jgi:hypothetical protein
MQNERVRLHWLGFYLETVTTERLFQYSAHNSTFGPYHFEYVAFPRYLVCNAKIITQQIKKWPNTE